MIRTRNRTGSTIPGNSADGVSTSPSSTPGGTASHALNNSSTTPLPRHRAHPTGARRLATHSGHHTSTRIEIVTIPPCPASLARNTSVMYPGSSNRSAPDMSKRLIDPHTRDSITAGADLRPAAAGFGALGFTTRRPHRRSYAARATGSASTSYAAEIR